MSDKEYNLGLTNQYHLLPSQNFSYSSPSKDEKKAMMYEVLKNAISLPATASVRKRKMPDMNMNETKKTKIGGRRSKTRRSKTRRSKTHRNKTSRSKRRNHKK
jgi:hypothetical protein